MAIFSKKVISAKFIDPPNNMLIEVLYREGDVAVPYVLEVDFTQQDFNDLLKEISLDDIQDVTKRELNTRAKFFNDIIDSEIERRWTLESEKIKQAYDKVDEYHLNKTEEINQIWEIESEKIKKAYQDVDKVWEIESQKIKEAYRDVDHYKGDLIKKAYDEVDQYAGSMKSNLAKEYRDQFLTPTKFSIDNLSGKEIFNHILKKNDNKDFVFDLKVGILEDVDIAKSNNKNLKLAIRKAKTVFELIKLYEEAKGIT